MKRKFSTIVSIFVLLFVYSANAQSEKSKVLAISKKVVWALKGKDMKALAGFVHPSKGVRFSPWSHVEKADLVFTANKLKTLLADKKVYQWGLLDESDEPIKMTFAKYYKSFVYDYDFANAREINYNLKQNNGIMINNIAKAYPKGVEVEYFIEGTEDRMYGSLRLIFEKQGVAWYLVGIIRDMPGI
jgi:hypothetical protein